VQTPGGADLQVTVRFGDGSLGTITYATGGHARFPKETLDLSGGGRSARLDNFTRVSVWTPSGRSVKRGLTGQDKGQRATLESFLEGVRTGGPMPIDRESLVAITRATIAVGESLASGSAVTL
jgi:hypothetical protein